MRGRHFTHSDIITFDVLTVLTSLKHSTSYSVRPKSRRADSLLVPHVPFLPSSVFLSDAAVQRVRKVVGVVDAVDFVSTDSCVYDFSTAFYVSTRTNPVNFLLAVPEVHLEAVPVCLFDGSGDDLIQHCFVFFLELPCIILSSCVLYFYWRRRSRESSVLCKCSTRIGAATSPD